MTNGSRSGFFFRTTIDQSLRSKLRDLRISRGTETRLFNGRNAPFVCENVLIQLSLPFATGFVSFIYLCMYFKFSFYSTDSARSEHGYISNGIQQFSECVCMYTYTSSSVTRGRIANSYLKRSSFPRHDIKCGTP